MNNVLDGSNENGWNSLPKVRLLHGFYYNNDTNTTTQEEGGSERLLLNAEWYGVYFAAALMNSNTATSPEVQNNTVSRRNMCK